MTIEHLKRASKTPETETGTVTIVPLKYKSGRMTSTRSTPHSRPLPPSA